MKTINSSANNFSFSLATTSWKKDNGRAGEIKLSETLCFGESTSNCDYVVLGISEDIGPQMNNGLAGAKNGFQTFLSTFQNIQSNRFLNGNEIGILGEIIQNEEFVNQNVNKNVIEELDEFVLTILQQYTDTKQTLIVIGGGHNNAYPLIKYAKSKNINDIHAINIDPHADCRKTDFRHSGNPFSFAIEEKILKTYSIIGLHQSYNNEYIYDFLNKHEITVNYFEDYLDSPQQFWDHLHDFSNNLPKTKTYTLDLDLDAIANMPSSAFTPSGFTVEDCRRMIRLISSKLKFNHLHLPEGSPKTEDDHKKYGKVISYLVVDFIKSQINLSKSGS